MDPIQIISFTLVALLLVVSPGPNGMLIAKTVPLAGRAAGFANVAGFLVAFYLHGTLSILGISVILTKSAEAFFVFKMLGALYLIWIGLKALISAFTKVEAAKPLLRSSLKRTLNGAFFEGFLTNALNPKVSMFYLAAFPQFIPAGESAIAYGFMLVSIHAVMNMLWFAAMVIIFARLSAAAKHAFFQNAIKLLTGIIFIGFGGKLLTLERQ